MCKCGRIPPCYGGKKFRIHEELEKIKAWYETHDKVYELIKQMCDIDKHLSEAGYFRMICDGQIETRKKLIDMEEKKTKKMTKAEAFEWLKCKKVCVSCREISEKVQSKLFACGVQWKLCTASFASWRPACIGGLSMLGNIFTCHKRLAGKIQQLADNPQDFRLRAFDNSTPAAA